MALDPSTRYPGQIDTVTDPTGYPFGQAQNILSPGDGVGTPWEKDIVNDVLGFQQAILDAVGATPTNIPDKVGASQYLDALIQLFAASGLQHFSYTPNAQVKALAYDNVEDIFFHPNGNEHDAPQIMAVGGAGGNIMRSDRGDFWKIEAGLNMTFPNGVACDLDDATAPVWVVVGNSSSIDTSVDGGVTWTARTSVITGTLTRVRFGGGLFVCIGNTDEIQTSPDGITWTIRANPTTEDLIEVFYSPDEALWVIVGELGTVLTSIDGMSWVDRTGFSAASSSLQAVSFDVKAGLWVSGGNQEMQTTPDPQTDAWTDRSAAFGFSGSQLISALAYNGVGVTLATRRFGITADEVDAIGISFDGGVTWDKREYDFAEPGGQLNRAIYVAGRWFVAGTDDASDGLILTSPRV